MPHPARPKPADDIEDRDPGLARERTELAWTRTAISFAALGAAMLRTSATAGAVVIASGVAVWGLGQLSARETQPTIRKRWFGRWHIVQLITAATALVSLVALALALVAPGSGVS